MRMWTEKRENIYNNRIFLDENVIKIREIFLIGKSTWKLFKYFKESNKNFSTIASQTPTLHVLANFPRQFENLSPELFPNFQLKTSHVIPSRI